MRPKGSWNKVPWDWGYVTVSIVNLLLLVYTLTSSRRTPAWIHNYGAALGAGCAMFIFDLGNQAVDVCETRQWVFMLLYPAMTLLAGGFFTPPWRLFGVMAG